MLNWLITDKMLMFFQVMINDKRLYSAIFRNKRVGAGRGGCIRRLGLKRHFTNTEKASLKSSVLISFLNSGSDEMELILSCSPFHSLGQQLETICLGP